MSCGLCFSKVSPKKKRKRRTSDNVTQEVQSLELLALGTVTGNILLYSVVKSDLHSQLTADGHEDRVNDMSWLTAADSLFSCSSDKQVIEWCISTSKVKKYVSDRNGGSVDAKELVFINGFTSVPSVCVGSGRPTSTRCPPSVPSTRQMS
jgi:WD40 repeat protein